MTLLTVFAPLFSAPSFRKFTMLACGFVAQAGKRTVCSGRTLLIVLLPDCLAARGLKRLWVPIQAYPGHPPRRAVLAR